MRQSIKYLGLLAILPLMMVALSPEIIEDASAKMAEGSPGTVSPKSYGSSTKSIVCGDRLCSSAEADPQPGNIGRAQ